MLLWFETSSARLKWVSNSVNVRAHLLAKIADDVLLCMLNVGEYKTMHPLLIATHKCERPMNTELQLRSSSSSIFDIWLKCL